MWFIVKILSLLAGVIARQWAKNHRPPFDEKTAIMVGSQVVYVHPRKYKGRLVATNFVIPYATGVLFKLSRESRLDRFFKALGLADEVQTADEIFDQLIYVASDSTRFRIKVAVDAKLRDIIALLFARGATSVHGDGQLLWVEFPDEADLTKLPPLVTTLQAQLNAMPILHPGLLEDPYAWRVFAVEAVIWSLGAYAATSGLQYLFTRDVSSVLNFTEFINAGLQFGAAAALLAATLVFFIMRGSALPHRILIETSIVLALSFPIGGIGALYDVNVEFDRAKSTVVRAEVVTRRIEKVRRRRSSGYRFVYWLELNLPNSNLPFGINSPAQSLRVSKEDWDRTGGSEFVNLEIAPGRAGFPWIRSIERSL